MRFAIPFFMVCLSGTTAAVARPAFLPRVTPDLLVGQWRETKRGHHYQGFTPKFSYYTFRKRGGRLLLKASAGAILWSSRTSAGQTKYYQSRLHAQDYASCSIQGDILACRMRRSCGKLHALERRRCMRMNRTTRSKVQIWRNDIFGFDLLILGGDKPAQQQKWFYRIPGKPRRRTAESRLLTNWYASGGHALGQSSLRLFWTPRLGFRYRMVVDTKNAAGTYVGLTVTTGTFRAAAGRIDFAQRHAFFCPGIFQTVPSFESVYPADLAVCRGGPRPGRFFWPYRLHRAGRSFKGLFLLDVNISGRHVRMQGRPE